MKKSKKQLIALLLVLGGCVLLFGGVLIYNNWQEKKTAEEEEAATVYLGDIESAVEITYNNGTETLNFSLGDDGKWVYTDDSAFPLDETNITKIASQVVGLTAVREITDYDSLAEFGLDKPAQTLKVTDANGSTLELLLGNLSGDGKNYYAMEPNGTSVYTIDSLLQGYLSKTLCDMAVLDKFPTVDETNIQSITLTSGDTTALLDKETHTSQKDTGEKDADGNAITEEVADYYWYATINGGTRTFINDITTVLTGEDGLQYTLENRLDSLLTGLGDMTLFSCVDYKASADTLASYGFNEPMLTLTVAYTDDSGNAQSYTLIIGNKQTDDSDDDATTDDSASTENIYYYAKLDGSDLTCLINANKLTTITNLVTAAEAISGS